MSLVLTPFSPLQIILERSWSSSLSLEDFISSGLSPAAVSFRFILLGYDRAADFQNPTNKIVDNHENITHKKTGCRLIEDEELARSHNSYQ